MEKMLISGVAKDDNVARISIIGVPDKPGIAFKIFSKLASKEINVDIILQSIGRNGTKDITFTVPANKMDDAIALLQRTLEKWGASNIVSDDNVTKVSIVGAGMETHPGVAAEMFEALFDAQREHPDDFHQRNQDFRAYRQGRRRPRRGGHPREILRKPISGFPAPAPVARI